MRVWLLVACLLTGCLSLRQPTVGEGRRVVLYPQYSQQSQAVVGVTTISAIASLSVIPMLETSTGSFSPISALNGNPVSDGASDMLVISQEPPIDPARPFYVTGLKANKHYRFLGRAYNAANNKISKENLSYVDLLVGNEDRPLTGNLPIYLSNVPFSATASAQINVTGSYDYLKALLYLGSTQVSFAQTSRPSPSLVFEDLQGNSTYKLVIEAYRSGAMQASASLDLVIGNDTNPAPQSLSFSVP